MSPETRYDTAAPQYPLLPPLVVGLMKKMRIDYLADHERFILPLAEWHHQEWSYLRPDQTLEDRIERLRASCGRREIPTAFIAFDEGGLLGSAILVANDMDSRPDLSPWLAGVFVHSGRRKCGIGSALVKRVMDEAGAIGVSRLYLFTPDASEFYLRLGWKILERTQFRGVDVTVMAVDLPDKSSDQSADHA